MKRQMVKGLTMFFAIVAVAFGTAVAASAQSRPSVITNVPFDFVVGAKTLQAGKYVISPNGVDGTPILMIRNSEASNSIFRLTNRIQPDRNKTQARLVFHRYGQSYFLAEVWMGGDTAGRELLRSKQESSLRRDLGKLAKNDYETIELVAMVR